MYNNVIAELDYEIHTQFEPQPDLENEPNAIEDDLTPKTTPIDYMMEWNQTIRTTYSAGNRKCKSRNL